MAHFEHDSFTPSGGSVKSLWAQCHLSIYKNIIVNIFLNYIYKSFPRLS